MKEYKLNGGIYMMNKIKEIGKTVVTVVIITLVVQEVYDHVKK
jgi:hypothetical protein